MALKNIVLNTWILRKMKNKREENQGDKQKQKSISKVRKIN